jgi:hypothetical protein
LFGVAAVIVTVGVCANVCIGLWTRSTVEAVAQDAARDLAATPAGELDRQRVDTVLSRARERLGPVAAATELRLERLDDRVAVRVRHPGVSLLPRLVAGPSVGAVDELVVVGREDLR